MYQTKLDDLKKLYADIAALTKHACRHCIANPALCSCCKTPEYGEMAIELAQQYGVELKPVREDKCPLLGPEGCIAEPYLRPLCSLHICDKLLFSSPYLMRDYYDLRDKINRIECEIFEESHTPERYINDKHP